MTLEELKSIANDYAKASNEEAFRKIYSEFKDTEIIDTFIRTKETSKLVPISKTRVRKGKREIYVNGKVYRTENSTYFYDWKDDVSISITIVKGEIFFKVAKKMSYKETRPVSISDWMNSIAEVLSGAWLSCMSLKLVMSGEKTFDEVIELEKCDA